MILNSSNPPTMSRISHGSKFHHSTFLVGYWIFFIKRVLHCASFRPLLLAFFAFFCGKSNAAEGIAFFEQKIRPVLVEHCYSCHSAEAKKLKGNLYLDSKAGWEQGGDSGEPAIIPGQPEQSLFIRTIQHLEEDMEMPPKKPKLPDAVIADLVAWVKMGAPDPRDGAKIEAKRADKSWWSLQPLATKHPQDSVDSFITAKLAETQLALNPSADPRALIRRMTYDLHGLPPTPEEVEAFAKKHQATPRQAIESLVDRLLASPRYGERYGRHWLDVIRFGESNGFERNFVIDDLWPFRDWVIQSINEDKPFDRFMTEHLAGDVIGKDQPEVEIGTAFLVAGPYDDVGNQDLVAQANIRAATLDDMVTATGSAFLGLTINCARCHNHKFDPIPAEDYFRIKSAFEGIKHGRRVVATPEQRAAFAAATKPLNQQLAKLNSEKDALEKDLDRRAKDALANLQHNRPQIDPHGTEETFQPVTAKRLRFVIHEFDSNYGNPAAKRNNGGKLTEFEVFDTQGRNVALAAHGTKAMGERAMTAEDFPEAYGPQYCIDGKLGESWFIGSPPVLTLTFAKSETIERINFVNARGERGLNESKVRGATPTEYEIQVSSDGETWTTVATSEGREPLSPAHALAKARKAITTAADESQLAALSKQIAVVQAKLNAVPKLEPVWVGLPPKQPTEPTYLDKGGDPMKPGDVVAPASLAVLSEVTPAYELPADAPEGERRLALAKWITQDNPLTARVLANRVWQWHFGTGIVDTPSDFGFLGSQPTHPELLDYLAARLVANGWKLKALHREILLSKTYQQSAADREAAAKEDKDARLLWRFPPRRLSAEEIRDTMLAVAGKLQLEPMGGPGFRLYKFTQNNVCTYFPLDTHGPETYRRAVYHQNARASVVDVLNDFDLPDIAFAAPKRANTTTPLQALTLLNHSFTLDMAAALAARVDGPEVVETLYRILFQREPTASESGAAYGLIAKHGLPSLCRALLNANELLYLE
jgi:mono/diheme cytochrome c family protein